MLEGGEERDERALGRIFGEELPSGLVLAERRQLQLGAGGIALQKTRHQARTNQKESAGSGAVVRMRISRAPAIIRKSTVTVGGCSKA